MNFMTGRTSATPTRETEEKKKYYFENQPAQRF